MRTTIWLFQLELSVPLVRALAKYAYFEGPAQSASSECDEPSTSIGLLTILEVVQDAQGLSDSASLLAHSAGGRRSR